MDVVRFEPIFPEGTIHAPITMTAKDKSAAMCLAFGLRNCRGVKILLEGTTDEENPCLYFGRLVATPTTEETNRKVWLEDGTELCLRPQDEVIRPDIWNLRHPELV